MFAPSNMRAARTPGITDPVTAACTKTKSADELSSPRRAGKFPAPARGGLRPIRAAPGGLTRLSTAGGPPRLRHLRLGRRAHEAAKEGPCDERQARRNHRDFSRCGRSALRSASQPPLPIRDESHASSRAPRESGRAQYPRAGESGDRFIEGVRKRLNGRRK